MLSVAPRDRCAGRWQGTMVAVKVVETHLAHDQRIDLRSEPLLRCGAEVARGWVRAPWLASQTDALQQQQQLDSLLA